MLLKKGIDISHYQIITDYERLNKQDFIICKCTEALTFTDPTFKKNKTEIRQLSRPIFGAYHYYDGGDAEKEALWFLSNIGEITADDILALDFEIECSDPVNKCRIFLEKVKEKTGVIPYLYTNEARVLKYDWTPVAKIAKLWVAKYPNQ